MHEGLESVRLGLRGIPGCSEDVMVARDILLAELTGVRYHVAHISSRHAVEMVRVRQGAWPQRHGRGDAASFRIVRRRYGALRQQFKMKPPLRSHCEWMRWLTGVVSGAIDAIATDHAPHPGSEKMQEFEKCPFGIIGLETAIGIALEYLVHPAKISVGKLVELFTTGPARILGLDRGTLAQGSVADVTIFSTDREWTYDVNKSFSKSRNSPFDGRTFRGGPVATIVGGRLVWKI